MLHKLNMQRLYFFPVVYFFLNSRNAIAGSDASFLKTYSPTVSLCRFTAERKIQETALVISLSFSCFNSSTLRNAVEINRSSSESSKGFTNKTKLARRCCIVSRFDKPTKKGCQASQFSNMSFAV